MKCSKCGKVVSNNFRYCPHCGNEFEEKTNEKYKNPYGFWEVTTEGDVEGKTTKHLGTHKGYLDEIAFALADKCYYSLRFKLKEELKPTHHNKVHVSLPIESGTWDDKEMRINFFKEMLKDRPVKVSEGQYFASVLLEK